jgi:hypothetical protein
MMYTYGGTPADVLTTSTGDVVPDYRVLIYRANTDEQVSALYEIDGSTPIAELRSNPAGHAQPGAIRPFKIPDVTAIEYAYNGPSGEVRWYQPARELAQQAASAAAGALSRAEGGTVAAPVTFAAGASVVGGLQVEDGLTVDEVDVDRLTVRGGILAGPTAIDVRVYGAVGDGIADDAPAIQQALNAATPGGEVLVPPGDYRLATLPLRIYRGTHLRLMSGARFIRAADATLITNGDSEQNYPGYTGHGDLVIEGGLWDMRGTAAGLTASRMCISLGHAQNITIRDLEVRDVPGYHAVEINSSKNVRITGCSFRGFIDPGGREFSEAVQPDISKGSAYFGAFGPYDHVPVEDLLIQGCYFGPSGTPGTTSWPRGVGSHSATITRWHKRVRVLGNTFEGCAQYAMTAYSYQDTVFSGNTVVGCGAGFRAQPPVLSDPDDTMLPDGTQTGASQDCSGFTIAANTFRDMAGYDDVIRLHGSATGRIKNSAITGNVISGTSNGSKVGIGAEYADEVTVAANTLVGVAGSAISMLQSTGANVSGNRVRATGYNGVTVENTSAVTVADNLINECGNNGLHLIGGSQIRMTDNEVRGASGPYGIRISSGADTVLLTGNRVLRRGSGTEYTEALGVTSTVTNLTRSGNVLVGTITDLSVNTANPRAWQPLTLTGTWAGTGAATDPQPMARWSLDGYLELSGIVRGTALAAGASGAVCTLPAHLIPPVWGRAPIIAQNGLAQATVNPTNGVVTVINGATAGTTTTWYQLDGVRVRIN